MGSKRIATKRTPHPTRLESQKDLLRIARSWYEGVGLQTEPVDLGLCLEYKVMEGLVWAARTEAVKEEAMGQGGSDV